MNRDVLLIAGGVGLGLLLVACLSPWSPLVKTAVPEGWSGTTWGPHTTQDTQTRGGLYHPDVCGENRSGLIEHGWEWIANPPSELTGPGVGNA